MMHLSSYCQISTAGSFLVFLENLHQLSGPSLKFTRPQTFFVGVLTIGPGTLALCPLSLIPVCFLQELQCQILICEIIVHLSSLHTDTVFPNKSNPIVHRVEIFCESQLNSYAHLFIGLQNSSQASAIRSLQGVNTGWYPAQHVLPVRCSVCISLYQAQKDEVMFPFVWLVYITLCTQNPLYIDPPKYDTFNRPKCALFSPKCLALGFLEFRSSTWT